jgi:hypothetical protein
MEELYGTHHPVSLSSHLTHDPEGTIPYHVDALELLKPFRRHS